MQGVRGFVSCSSCRQRKLVPPSPHSGAGANLTYSIRINKDNVTLDSIQPSPLLTAHSVITYDAQNEIFNYTYREATVDLVHLLVGRKGVTFDSSLGP
ncbi:hypothetical protein V8C34DRAFT_296178 [Trichoderma compactum]